MKISTLGLQIALVPNWLAELFHKNLITNLMLSLGTIEIVIRYNEESLIQHGIHLWKVNIILRKEKYLSEMNEYLLFCKSLCYNVFFVDI